MNPTITHTNVQNSLLLLLTLTSGTVDAISFLVLGQVFAAAMTGNTVLFGLAAVHASGLSVLRYIAALGGFIAGNALAAWCTRRFRRQTGWNRRLVRVLVIEFLFLVIAAIWMDSVEVMHVQYVMVILLAAAMGVQGVIARRVGVNGITTTVITSTLTGLMESIVWHSESRRVKDAVGQASGKDGTVSGLVLWASAIVVYGVGAAICGLVIHHAIYLAVWLPVLIVGGVIIVGYRIFRDETNMRA